MFRLRLFLASAILAGAVGTPQAQPAPTPVLPATPGAGTHGVPIVNRTPGPIKLQQQQAPTSTANNPLQFEKAMIDAGTKEEGTKVEFDFPVTNASAKKINITNIETGCGCTTVSQHKFELEPGAKSEIKVSFDTHGRRGPQSRVVTVHTDDPDHPTYPLNFKVDVTQTVWASVNFIDIRDVEEGKSSERKFSIFLAKESESPKVTVKLSEQDKATVELQEQKPFSNATQKGTEYVFKVTTLPTLPAGDHNLVAEFVTEPDSKFPNVNIRVNVQGPVQLNQSRIYGSFQLNEETSRTLQLTSRGGKPFTIKEMKADQNLPVKLTQQDAKDNPAAKEIVAHIVGPDKAATIQGRVHVVVQMQGEEKEYKLDLPVYLAFGRRRMPSPAPRQPAAPAAPQAALSAKAPVETQFK
ncbi:DUF1573 domain-containing protein [Candidatus Sumerlaeota bacterium]|nr:DUF1573 domain-containing protein [Candidatus Sumerlaeota bacterium]